MRWSHLHHAPVIAGLDPQSTALAPTMTLIFIACSQDATLANAIFGPKTTPSVATEMASTCGQALNTQGRKRRTAMHREYEVGVVAGMVRGCIHFFAPNMDQMWSWQGLGATGQAGFTAGRPCSGKVRVACGLHGFAAFC